MRRSIPRLLLCLPALALPAAAVIVRPAFTNDSGPNHGGAVLTFQGHIRPGGSGPGSAGKHLSEATWGHPFAVTQSASPSIDFAAGVLFGPGGVYDGLYPPGYGTAGGVSGTRADMADRAFGGALRCKWLIFAPDPDSPASIVNRFEQTFEDMPDAENPWFDDEDRAQVQAQIEVLRAALAVAPLNRELQLALLDIHTDLAVIEMQFARKRLAQLAKTRLGLGDVPPDRFIIDTEIRIHEELIVRFEGALAGYMDLLSRGIPGIDPGDFDPSFRGAPLGFFIFANRVPARSQTATDLGYATEGGGIGQIVDPGTSPVFAGHKDYRLLVTVLGQFMQAKTDLARLLAMRGADDDLTRARQALSEVQGPLASAFCLLEGIFPAVDWNDPVHDPSGVRAAFTLVEAALNDSVHVRSFVNGSTNVLGLDPNFLLLVPTKPAAVPPVFDTYDILAAKLTETSGGTPVGPLAYAVAKLGDPGNPTGGGGAIQAYLNFRESEESVADELREMERQAGIRFEKITGYPWDGGTSGWNGLAANPDTGSELATVERTITSLNGQRMMLRQVAEQLEHEVRQSNEAVSLAIGIRSAVTGAEAGYLGNTASAWTETHVWSGLAAGSQAASEAIYNMAGVDGISTFFSAGTTVAAIAVTGAVNTAVQTAAATRLSMREQDIDTAAIGFETDLVLAQQPLTVQQAKLKLAEIMRACYSHQLEQQANLSALAQAVADKQALLREVERIEDHLDADRAALASRYFADPVHYLRAETAMIDAEAAFRRAQRWVFFTARALEYKWQERFSYAPGSGKSFDIQSIFKARNASELEEIAQHLAFFDQDRELAPGTRRDDRVTISFRKHILTPNPDDLNREFGAYPPDLGLRHEPSTGEVVSAVERFRNILREKQVAGTSPGGGVNGDIRITFDTSQLEIGQLFAGPDYSDPDHIESGLYRDKIDWLAVHFVFRPGALVKGGAAPEIPGNNGVDGSMTYGGNTYFRTRIPPGPDRSPGSPLLASDRTISSPGHPEQIRRDFPGEFVIAPFRYYQDTSFSGVFDVFDQQNASSLEYLFSTQSAENPTVAALIESSIGFQIKDFTERSVAATRWVMKINRNQFHIDDLEDIELIIQHRAYTRPQIAPAN